MKLKDFIQAFPNLNIKEVMDSSDWLKASLTDLYNKVEMISLNYNLDDVKPDQIQPLINELKSVMEVLKR